MKGLRIFILLASSVLSMSAGAYGNNNGNGNNGGSSVQTPAPTAGSATCMDHGKVLGVINEQALQWKATQASGFHSRALVSGTVDEVFPDQTGHRHFSIKIGAHNDDHIEVIYNESFGAMPVPQAGETVEACGDFIVATQKNGGFPPSPDGALVHWVHKSPHQGAHDDGFVILNGLVYGFENGSGN